MRGRRESEQIKLREVPRDERRADNRERPVNVPIVQWQECLHDSQEIEGSSPSGYTTWSYGDTFLQLALYLIDCVYLPEGEQHCLRVETVKISRH